jgi:hypothetical protein
LEYALKNCKLSLAFGDITGDHQRGVQIGKRICSALGAAGLHHGFQLAAAEQVGPNRVMTPPTEEKIESPPTS